MTLMLELSPAEERELVATAEKEGISVEEYILRRVLPSRSEPPETWEQRRSRVVAGFAASGMTEEELEEYAVQAVKQVRAERRAKEAQP
jgi:hypothetical protein